MRYNDNIEMFIYMIMINRKYKLVSSFLLAATSFAMFSTAHTKACTGNGVGILLGVNFSKPTVKFKINRKVISASAYEFLKALIKKELADSNLSNRTEIDFALGNSSIDLDTKANKSYNCFKELLEKDENSIKTYPNISKDNWSKNYLIIKDSNDYYIRSEEVNNDKSKTDDAKAKEDIAVSDVIDNSSFVDNNIKELRTYKDVSKCQFAIDLGAFYNIKIYDWIIRPEIDFSIPVSNRTIKLESSGTDSNTQQTNDNKTNEESNIEFTKSFDIKFKLLGGYHITERIKILLGVGAVYSRYKLKTNLVNPFSSSTNDKVLSYAWNEASKALSSQYEKEKSFGKWNLIGILGLEFNINDSNMVSLEFSGGPARQVMKSSMEKSLGDLTFSNVWTLGLSYKFMF